MIKTKQLIYELDQVPTSWIFEHYLKLSERLEGQSITVKSAFNPRDKRPSMNIMVSNRDNKTYVFKDFSTGISGGGVTLVEKMFNLPTRGEAAHRIIEDYNEFILSNPEGHQLKEFKVQQRYKVVDCKPREWNTIDQKYWTNYHIGSRLLEKFRVRPLKSYILEKEEEGEKKTLCIEGRHCIYGYFREDGTLYKVYQPLVKDKKFIKVRDYIQGTDQLTFSRKFLVITSSLKDVMGFTRLGYPEAETVSPDSENTLIPLHVISSYRIKYEGVCTLFDNDEAGIAAMNKYNEIYGLKSAHLVMSKDLTDSMRDYSLLKVKEQLTPLLRQALR